jgi:hypothetical protein
MRSRIQLALLVVVACAGLGGKCGGGDGSGGGGGGRVDVTIESPDDRCAALSSPFPPGFDFVPGDGSLVWVADLSPPSLVPLDVTATPPTQPSSASSFALPFDSDGDGREEGSSSLPISPIFDDIHIVDAELALVTASSYEEVLFFSPAAGDLVEFDVSVPAAFAKNDYPLLPDPGADAEPRTAVSTFACVRPPLGALDSRGDPIALSLPSSVWCDRAQPSYLASFTSGAALAGDRLFVAASNLGADPGTSNTQYLPGAVLVYELDRDADPPTLEPSEATPVLITTGFNPSHVTALEVDGRPFVLVTVSGAVGVAADDPDTDEIEAAGIALTEGAIDVIDADTLEIVATIPLGLAGLASSGLRVDATGRVGVVGSVIGRQLFAVDLAPLADLPDSVASPVVLDGVDGDDAVIFDADEALPVPPRANGAPAASCPGATEGVAFGGARLFATESCDGTLAEYLVDLSGDPPAPVPRDRFKFIELRNIAAPIRSDTLTEPRSPGAVAVRPGAMGDGPDVVLLIGQQEGLVCGIKIE